MSDETSCPALKPSEVLLVGVFPLTNTFNRVERELAAALIVRVCQVQDDRWQAVSLAQVAAVFKDDLTSMREPWSSLGRNPFTPRPGFEDLAARGFARWDASHERIELTPAGLEAIGQRWRRKEVSDVG